MITNPFLDGYLTQELEFYGLREPYEAEGLLVKMTKLVGRLDDYLNKNFRVGEVTAPVLYSKADDRWTLWMSLTYMEAQSSWLPIERARGRVVTGGLGLGYFPLRAASKENVREVVVYEKDERVVHFFNRTFAHRPEFKKIKIITGDVRELLHDETADFCFMDIYSGLLAEETLTDFETFWKNNTFDEYQFWGEELAALSAFEKKLLCILLPYEKEYLKMWLRTPYMIGDEVMGKLPDLYRPCDDDEYLERYALLRTML